MAFVGLDFGTTYSALAYFDGVGTRVVRISQPPAEWATLGLDLVLPSAVGVSEDGQLTFGWDAKCDPSTSVDEVKRLLASADAIAIGSRCLPVDEAAALALAGLRQRASDRGSGFDRAVLAVPANSCSRSRFRTRLAGQLSGVEVTALVSDPLAAAMAHHLDLRDDQTILVVDWGGGTLDVSLVETVGGVFIERATKGIHRLGGLDVDRAFAQSILDSLPTAARWSRDDRRRFWLEVERAKILLSDDDTTTVRLPAGARVEVTRRQFEGAARPVIDRARAPISRCLSELGIDPHKVDHLVMVGGMSKVPLSRRLVSEWVQREPTDGADPLTAIAEGAAVASAILAGELDRDFFVATEHAAGIVSHDAGGGDRFVPVIPRNHRLPTRRRHRYVANGADATITVVEGDPAQPIDHPDNVRLGVWRVDVVQSESSQQVVTLTYSYSADGVLHVVAHADDGRVLFEDDGSFGGGRDRAELHRMASRVREAVRLGVLAAPAADEVEVTDPVTADLLGRIRAILGVVTAGEAAHLASLCARVEDSAGRDEIAVSALGTASRAFAHLL